jgi:hypothetical protein
MKSWFVLFFAISVMLFSTTTKAQNIDTLIYNGTFTVPFKATFNDKPIEELSGIEYTGWGNQYYLIPQSRTTSYVFLCTIDLLEEGMDVKFDSLIYLNHGPLEAESIRVNPFNQHLYIAEEGLNTSFIYHVDEQNNLNQIYNSTAAQKYNSGYEGLCFDQSGKKMFISLERPQKGYMSEIIVRDLEKNNEKIYNYPLDKLPLDKNGDNGITELLNVNDSTLIVVERAYLGIKNGNSIRVYKAIIPKKGNNIIKEKLLTDFSASPVIDNIEGVTYSASGKELIFVSDNNANRHQQTLFICMKVQ